MQHINGKEVARLILMPATNPVKRKWRIFKCDGQWCASTPDLRISYFKFWNSARIYVKTKLENDLSQQRRLF